MLSRLMFLILVSTNFGCSTADDSFDLLQGTGGTVNVDELTITEFIPDSGTVIIEIGQSVEFFISAQAPIGRTISYKWQLDGNNILSGTQRYTFAGTAGNVGSYILTAVVNDTKGTREQTWNVKVNGPPIVTPVTTGTPKVSIGSTIIYNVTATDPNSDALTYTWLLNGVASTDLVGTGNSATLTGNLTDVGNVNITVQVSDGTASASHTFASEVNHFPQACNTLAQGEICTYAGNPHKGNGLIPGATSQLLRFRPIAQVQDALENLFLADYEGNVVWYWNKTAAAVTRLGVTIPAGVAQVVAGTGEAASGAQGIPALQSSLYGPRSLHYDNGSDTLYVGEWSGSRVKYIASSGIVNIGFGGLNSHVDGDSAYNHDCNNPGSLHYYAPDNSIYISCYGHHRVKRWDLTLDQGFTVAGDGGNDVTGNPIAPTLGGVGQPYGLFVNADGIFMGSLSRDVIRYVNTSGAPKTFWSGNPDQVIVANGDMATIMGTGGTGNPNANEYDPLSIPISNPGAIAVSGDLIYVSAYGRNDLIVGNNSGAPVTYDARSIAAGRSRTILSTSGGYNGNGHNLNNARISTIYDMEFDVTNPNLLWISDYGSYRLRQINLTTETLDDMLGSGRGLAGTLGTDRKATNEHLFNYPSGLAFDDNNQTLYFVDKNNHMIRDVDRFGRTATVLSAGGGDPTVDDEYPTIARMRTNFSTTNSYFTGLDLHSDGSLLQINSYGHNLRIWNKSGSGNTYLNTFISDNRVSTVAGDWASGVGDGPAGPALSAQMRYPSGGRFYESGGITEVFYADRMNHCIRKIDNNGDMVEVIGTCGTAGHLSNDDPEAATRFNRLNDIVFDSLGNLFISDENNHRIKYWNRTGSAVNFGPISVGANRVMTVICSSGASGSTSENVLATSARCNRPQGLAISGNTLCFAQASRHNVRCMDMTTGRVNTMAGNIESTPRAGRTLDFAQEGIPATSANLYAPTGLTFDANGDLYISDTYGHVIRKVKLSP